MIDLHLHSTASDGTEAPAAVVRRAAAAGCRAIALTDHDTIAGCAEAIAEGARLGVRVVAGCEFSVKVPWGELHLLGYFLPVGHETLEAFLAAARHDRERRGHEIAARLRAAGVPVSDEAVARIAGGGAVGRPHLARAVVEAGGARDIQQAFDRYLRRGRPGFVEKALPLLDDTVAMVHALGGVVSAAHLKAQGTRQHVAWLAQRGVDAIETRHPSHDPDTRAHLTELALALGRARTGGSDWHGPEPLGTHGPIGGQDVPDEWLERLEALAHTAGAAA